MKKNIYRLSNIDCVACAFQIEDKLNKLKGVSSCSLNYILFKLFVTFDDNIISDEDIELYIHQSLNSVRIVEKNGDEFIDTYEAPNVFKKILFGGRRKR